MLRPLLLGFVLVLSTQLFAADAAKGAVPPPPPIPPASADDKVSAEPTITVIQKEDATITEYRISGKLYQVKVKPAVGPEYYLVDEIGDGSMVRRDTQNQVRPPMWVIKRF